MIRVGQISYLNTEPFFHFWPSDGFERVPGTPRELAQKGASGQVDAGPFPLVDCWALEDSFEFLGNWAIASRERSGSVFVLSRRPFSQLRGATIGVTHDSSTSALLCALLLQTRHGLKARLKRGLDRTDDAWLVIGDEALRYKYRPMVDPFEYVTDLASEWWDWQRRPFVFARWVVRRTASPGDKARLEWLVAESLKRGLYNLPEVAKIAADRTDFPAPLIESYLSEFVYDIGEEAEESTRVFRGLLEDAGIIRLPLKL